MPKRVVVESAVRKVLYAAPIAAVQEVLPVVEHQVAVTAVGSAVVMGDVVTMTKSVVRMYVSDAIRLGSQRRRRLQVVSTFVR